MVGCLNDNAPKTPPASKAKGGVVTPVGAKTTSGSTFPAGGSGIPNPTGSGFQPGTYPGGPTQPAGANPYNTGGISGPAATGIQGPGAPLPGQYPVTVPSVTPSPSGYPPTVGTTIPPGYGSMNTGALPTTARGAAPTQPTSLSPPTLMLTEAPPQPIPPAPPGGTSSLADLAPPVAPTGAPPGGPVAPPSFPPTAPR
jgi:hypothetical protein